MATVTPNFNWPVPTSGDLVKNGATAIEALGDAIDASMADLEGGTSGQILAKNSNTDMDFVWITNDVGDITAVTAGTGISGGGTSGAVTVTNSMATAIDAKGDLVPGTGADTFARLAVGANNRVLMADSTAATGLKYGGEWVSYTPTFANLTVGNGTLVAAYSRVGDNVFVRIELSFGSTTSITGSGVTVSNPVTGFESYHFLGAATLWGIGGGNPLNIGTVWATNTANSAILVQNSSSTYTVAENISATIPFTWATGNILALQFQYRAA